MPAVPDAPGEGDAPTATDTILAAVHRMLAHDIRHLAVTKDSAMVGVVSMRDVLAFLADRPDDAGARRPGP